MLYKVMKNANQLQTSFPSAIFKGTLRNQLLHEFLLCHCTALILIKLLHDANGFLVAHEEAALFYQSTQLVYCELAGAISIANFEGVAQAK